MTQLPFVRPPRGDHKIRRFSLTPRGATTKLHKFLDEMNRDELEMRFSKVSSMIRTVCRRKDVVSRHVSTGCGFACFSSVMHLIRRHYVFVLTLRVSRRLFYGFMRHCNSVVRLKGTKCCQRMRSQ
jgi:hypothetical protein